MKLLVTPGIVINRIEQDMEECFKLSIEFINKNVLEYLNLNSKAN
jgi:hypothetical protein